MIARNILRSMLKAFDNDTLVTYLVDLEGRTLDGPVLATLKFADLGASAVLTFTRPLVADDARGPLSVRSYNRNGLLWGLSIEIVTNSQVGQVEMSVS